MKHGVLVKHECVFCPHLNIMVLTTYCHTCNDFVQNTDTGVECKRCVCPL